MITVEQLREIMGEEEAKKYDDKQMERIVEICDAFARVIVAKFMRGKSSKKPTDAE